MAKPLAPIGDFIRSTVEAFLRDGKQALEISIWFLLPPLLLLAGGYLAVSSPLAPIGLGVILAFLVAGAIITIRAQIRLTQLILALDAGRPKPDVSLAVPWPLFFSFAWVSILEGLAVLGGTVVFVLPGIWLTVVLFFSRLVLLEDGKKGAGALAASAELVKGRWWKVFWRIFIPGFLFLMVLLLADSIIHLLVGLIAGFDKIAALSENGASSPMAAGIQYLIQSVSQVLFIPLFVTWQVKLFHELKQTREVAK